MIKKFSGVLFQSIFFNPSNRGRSSLLGHCGRFFRRRWPPEVTLSYQRRRTLRGGGGGRYHNVRLGREGWVTLQPRSANQPTQKRTRREGKKKKHREENRKGECRVRTQRPSLGKRVTKSGLRLKSPPSHKRCLFSRIFQ